MKMKLAPFMLTLVFLVFLMTILVAAKDDGSDATTLTLGLKAVIRLLALNESTEWLLSPSHEGVETKTGYFVIQSNKEWQMQVKDENPLTTGHMREWNGTSYGERWFSDPLRIRAEREVILPQGGVIQSGNKTDYIEIPIIFEQEVSWMDEPLVPGEMYRIVVTFSANQQV
jgi:hypothetical protein